MDVLKIKNDSTLVIRLTGELNTLEAEKLMNEADVDFNETFDNIVFECENLNYISSSGLRVFLALYKKMAQRNGSMLIRSVKPEIQEIFNITGLNKIFTIE